MTIINLYKTLGDRVDVSLKDGLTPEEREQENEQTALIVATAKQMINVADIVLRYEKLEAQCKNLKKSAMPGIIGYDYEK